MLKELFESSFYITYPQKQNVRVSINERVHSGNFSLYDSLSCNACATCIADPTVRENIKISSSSPIHEVSMSEVTSFVKEDISENCDFVLDDGTKTIILLEMTCSQPKYVDGSKRNKATKQLYETLVCLFANPGLKQHIESYVNKYVVFSWKNTQNEVDRNDKVEQGFLAFTDFSDETYSPDNYRNFDFDFKFKEIRYPHVLEWDKL